MAFAVHSFTNILRRLLPGQSRSTAVPDLPNELIFDEILSHFHDMNPTSLAGLQVAFVCKEFYNRLKPAIARTCLHSLVEAYAKGKLAAFYHPTSAEGDVQTMSIANFTRMAQAAFDRSYIEPAAQLDIFPTFDLSYTIHFGTFDDATALWSLTSLLSIPRVAKCLRYFELELASSHLTNDGERYPVFPSDNWRRAFVALLGRAASAPEGVELFLYGAHGLIQGDVPQALLGRLPSSPSQFFKGCLRELTLSGPILDLLWPSPIKSLLHDSSDTLTHLSLGHGKFTGTQWKTAMSRCHHPMLQHFSIHDTSIPLATLTSFLLLNPSISPAEIYMPSGGTFRPGNRLEIRPEDRPRFLPRVQKLTGTTDFLLALFTPTSGTEIDIPLFNLAHLHIFKELMHGTYVINYSGVTDVLSRIPPPNRTSKQALIALRSIALEIPYGRPQSSGSNRRSPPGAPKGAKEGMAVSLFHAASDFVSPPPHAYRTWQKPSHRLVT